MDFFTCILTLSPLLFTKITALAIVCQIVSIRSSFLSICFLLDAQQMIYLPLLEITNSRFHLVLSIINTTASPQL